MWHGKFSAGKKLSCLFNISTLSYSDNNNSSLISNNNNNNNNVAEVTKLLIGQMCGNLFPVTFNMPTNYIFVVCKYGELRSAWFTPDIINAMKIVLRSVSLLRVIINLYVLLYHVHGYIMWKESCKFF